MFGKLHGKALHALVAPERRFGCSYVCERPMSSFHEVACRSASLGRMFVDKCDDVSRLSRKGRRKRWFDEHRRQSCREVCAPLARAQNVCDDSLASPGPEVPDMLPVEVVQVEVEMPSTGIRFVGVLEETF